MTDHDRPRPQARPTMAAPDGDGRPAGRLAAGRLRGDAAVSGGHRLGRDPYLRVVAASPAGASAYGLLLAAIAQGLMAGLGYWAVGVKAAFCVAAGATFSSALARTALDNRNPVDASAASVKPAPALQAVLRGLHARNRSGGAKQASRNPSLTTVGLAPISPLLQSASSRVAANVSKLMCWSTRTRRATSRAPPPRPALPVVRAPRPPGCRGTTAGA